MDVVHHALIGGAGYLAGASADRPLAGLAFLAGSVLPDLDVAFMAGGRRFYLKHHQGPTHSLLLAPLYAAAICLPLSSPVELGWSWWCFAGACLGLGLHVALDWTNTFGIGLFWPLSYRRYNLDAVFFIDAGSYALTGLFYLGYVGLQWRLFAFVYPVVLSIYLVIRVALHRRVTAALRPLAAIPSSLHPLEYYILARENGGLCGYLYNVWDGQVRQRREFEEVDEVYWSLAEQSRLFQDMRQITRAYRITSVENRDDGVVIHAGDLATRNFGGRFARTVLKFDSNGKLIHEMANI